MSNAALSTLCLLCVGICSLPGGDSNNFSFQRRPLDVSPLSPAITTRFARSLLAVRVSDHHGNPVSLRGNDRPVQRRVINPFVTSQARHQRPRTSDANGRSYEANEIHNSVMSSLPVSGSGRRRRGSRPQAPRQRLPASVGFAMYDGKHYDIRPHRGIVPHGPANQRRRHSDSTNHRGRQSNGLVNHVSDRRIVAGGKPNPQKNTTTRHSIKNKPTPPSMRRSQTAPGRHSSRGSSAIPRGTPPPERVTPQAVPLYGLASLVVPGQTKPSVSSVSSVSTVSYHRRPSSNGRSDTSAITTTSSRGSSSRSRALGQTQPGLSSHRRPSSGGRSGQKIRHYQPQIGPDTASSVYSHGLEPHMPLNARDMATFLIQRSTRPRQYVDRTKGTGTVHSSHPGQCPVVDQSRCSPLPTTLPPSCGNDYQCHGQESKCCYDPCLTFNKCVRPVNG